MPSQTPFFLTLLLASALSASPGQSLAQGAGHHALEAVEAHPQQEPASPRGTLEIIDLLEEARHGAQWGIFAHVSTGMVRVLESPQNGLPEVLGVANPPPFPIYAASYQTLTGGGLVLRGALPLQKGEVQLPRLPWLPQAEGEAGQSAQGPMGVPIPVFLGVMGALGSPSLSLEDDARAATMAHLQGEITPGQAFTLWALSTLGETSPLEGARALEGSEDPGIIQSALWAWHTTSLGTGDTMDVSISLLRRGIESGDPLSQSLAADLIRRGGVEPLASVLRSELAFAPAQVPTCPWSLNKPSEAPRSPQEAMTWALGSVDGSPEGAELLYLLLTGEDPSVAFAALRGLERQGDVALPLALESLVQSGSDPQVSMAIAALGRLRQGQGATPLIRVIQDPDRPLYQRTQAISALGMSRSEDAIALLSRLLDGEDPRLGHAAALALGHLGEALAFGPLCQSLSDPSKVDESLEALATLGPARKLIACQERLRPGALLSHQSASLQEAIARHQGLEATLGSDGYLSQLITGAARGADAIGQGSPGTAQGLNWALGVVESRHLTDLADDLRRALGLWRSRGGEPDVGIEMVRTLWRLQVPLSEEEERLIHSFFDGLGMTEVGIGGGLARG